MCDVKHAPVAIAQHHIDRPIHPERVHLARTAENERAPIDQLGATEESAGPRWWRLCPSDDLSDQLARAFDHLPHGLGCDRPGWVCSGSNHIVLGGSKVQKWEYATVPLISHALQEILNQWGEEGWELVQVVESQQTGTTAYLKRPKEDNSSAGGG